jgi:SNF2 family DNA or RNA helicase
VLLLAQGIKREDWKAAGTDKEAQRALRKAATAIPIRLALTGTAVVNRPVELITQLDYLGRLNDFGGFWGFAKQYCAAFQGRYGWDLSGASNLTELARKLRETCYVRREKRDVAPELPPVERVYVPIEIADMAAYQTALTDVISWMHGRHARVEAGDSERSFRAEALVRIEALKQLVAVSKLNAIVEWVEYWMESARPESKLILFAHHREIQDALRDQLATYNPAWLRAEDSVDARDAQIARFGADSSCRLMVASMAAGGTGVNLQCADAVAFVEFGWHSAIHDQAEGRISRIGQQAESLTSYWLAASGTFDEDIIALIDAKRAIVDTINAGVEADGRDQKQDVVTWFAQIMENQEALLEEKGACRGL